MGCNGTAGANAAVVSAPAGGSITLFAEEFICPGVDLNVRIVGGRGSRGQVRNGSLVPKLCALSPGPIVSATLRAGAALLLSGTCS